MIRAFRLIPALSIAAIMTPAATHKALAQNPQVKAGQIAPDFTTRTIDGETLRLSSLRGKVVLLNFWTTG